MGSFGKGERITLSFPTSLLLLFPFKCYFYYYCQLHIYLECCLSCSRASRASFLPLRSCWNPVQHFIFDVSEGKKKREKNTWYRFFFLSTESGMTALSIKPGSRSKFASYLSCLQHTPPCMVLLMNLNLLPQQLPSIILASAANSSPTFHFSPLKKSPLFPSLLWWNCLAGLPGKWFLSRTGRFSTGGRSDWMCGLWVYWAPTCSVCTRHVATVGPARFGDGEIHHRWPACSGSVGSPIKMTFILLPSIQIIVTLGGWNPTSTPWKGHKPT